MAVAGIHFGNTNSVISVYQDGRVETVSNETGDRITPTIVAYTGTEKMVGQPAKQYLIRNPLSCVSHIKAAIGKCFKDEFNNETKDGFSCKMSNKNGEISFEVKMDDDFVTVSSDEAASYIFTKLLEIAELVGGSDLEDIVLAVPHNFSEDQRMILCEAAENIGCKILRIISEPAAALIAYDIGQEDPSLCCNVLVYRLGGSSTDATIMTVNSGMYQFIGQKTEPDFGGEDFDKAMIEHLVQEFKRKFKEDISNNKRAIGKLKTVVEECKHGLSRMQSATCAVDTLHDGMDFHTQVPRAKFESMCGQLFSRCIQLVDQVILSCRMETTQIEKVILIGGGTRMPRLINLFKEKFKNSEVLHNIQPDEVLAQGAALQCALLQGREDIILNSTISSLECISKNIGIKIHDRNMEKLEVILCKNTPVPTRRSKDLEIDSSQTSVCIQIYESEGITLENSKYLAKLSMKNLTSTNSKELMLNFQINRNGHLLVALTEKTSNRTESVNIEIRTA